jgi:hypothetical protein
MPFDEQQKNCEDSDGCLCAYPIITFSDASNTRAPIPNTRLLVCSKCVLIRRCVTGFWCKIFLEDFARNVGFRSGSRWIRSGVLVVCGPSVYSQHRQHAEFAHPGRARASHISLFHAYRIHVLCQSIKRHLPEHAPQIIAYLLGLKTFWTDWPDRTHRTGKMDFYCITVFDHINAISTRFAGDISSFSSLPIHHLILCRIQRNGLCCAGQLLLWPVGDCFATLGATQRSNPR